MARIAGMENPDVRIPPLVNAKHAVHSTSRNKQLQTALLHARGTGDERLPKPAGFFDQNISPHLRAAYNFARWLVRNDHDAEDIVQESFMKAFAAADEFRGNDTRVWLFAIVRNTTINLLRRRRSERAVQWREEMAEPVDTAADPESAMISSSRRTRIRAAIAALPDDYREALVLREFEGLSYKEIASVINTPIGTVMSRLSRARALLLEQLASERRAGDELSRI
jgi:RNA polymerase sigma-70 factor (ECF subfamily)